MDLKPLHGKPIKLGTSGPKSLAAPPKDKLQQKKEETATQFEKMFALEMVRELTKGTFSMSDNPQDKGVAQIYRSHVNEVLADQLSQNHRLGIADMVIKYWDQKTDEPK